MANLGSLIKYLKILSKGVPCNNGMKLKLGSVGFFMWCSIKKYSLAHSKLFALRC